jgi:hypothetical protein
MDWFPTLLAAAGTAPNPACPLLRHRLVAGTDPTSGTASAQVFWRYKYNDQQAPGDGDWKYLKIRDNTFLFDAA